MKYDSSNHIIGKVYDLTQENMNAMLLHIDELKAQIKKNESEKAKRDRDYSQIYSEHNLLMIRNNKFRAVLEKVLSWAEKSSFLSKEAREALEDIK